MNDSTVEKNYSIARDRYAQMGVDTDEALTRLASIPLSIHCWQGDDVGGFEHHESELGGGLAVTGNFPGRARNVAELRADFELALQLIPGKHRINLHASYGEFSTPVDRDQIGVEHFQGWIDWAIEHELGIDFNPTFFAHEKASDGLTLAHADATVREFWIAHGVACRRIGAAIGSAQGTPCLVNVWIPDGMKDSPVDRNSPRQRLVESLDRMFDEHIDESQVRDSVESKLFGIGSESYVVGSHEFYLAYAITRQKVLCLDSGHFHPTESVADKISAIFQAIPELLLHLSRGVRWDSDHVVTWDDDLQSIAHEVVRGEFLSRTHVGLDFFDASINRIAAWVIGARNAQKAFLYALLEPTGDLIRMERRGDFTSRLALLEESKTNPFGAVWDYFCLQQNVPVQTTWLSVVRDYEHKVLVHRH